MNSQSIIDLTCYDEDETIMFEFFILPQSPESYIVHSRKSDVYSVENNFSFKTSNIEMIEYYVKSIYSDYAEENCSWSFGVYLVDEEIDCSSFQNIIDNVRRNLDTMFDYYISEINTLKTHINKYLNFLQNIEVIPQDLPDLIPVNLESSEEKEVPDIELDKRSEDSSEDLVFIKNDN